MTSHVLLFSCIFWNQTSDLPTLAEIGAGIDRRIAKYHEHSFRVQINVKTQYRPPKIPVANDGSTYDAVDTWILSPPAKSANGEWMWSWSRSTNEKKPPLFHITWNGKLERQLFRSDPENQKPMEPAAKLEDEKSKTAKRERKEADVGAINPFNSAYEGIDHFYEQMMFFTSPHPASGRLTISAHEFLTTCDLKFTGREKVAGADTILVEGTPYTQEFIKQNAGQELMKSRYWFDSSPNFMLRKWIATYKGDEIMRAEVTKIGEVQGIPYPQAGECHSYIKLVETGEEQREDYVFNVISFEVDPPLGDELFTIEWPAHTTISDSTTNTAFVVPPDPVESTEEDLNNRRMKADHALKGSEPTTSSTPWLFVLASGILVVLASTLLWRRFRHRMTA